MTIGRNPSELRGLCKTRNKSHIGIYHVVTPPSSEVCARESFCCCLTQPVVTPPSSEVCASQRCAKLDFRNRRNPSELRGLCKRIFLLLFNTTSRNPSELRGLCKIYNTIKQSRHMS